MSNVSSYHGATKAEMPTDVSWVYHGGDDMHSVVSKKNGYQSKTIMILFDVDSKVNTTKPGTFFGFCCATEFKERFSESLDKPKKISVYSSLEDAINEENAKLYRLDDGPNSLHRLQYIHYTGLYNKTECLVGFPIWSNTKYEKLVDSIS